MKNEEWLVVDTETNGLYQPIFTLEIAAQRMIGWEPVGEPFRVLLNHDVPIDPAAQAVHGYSREFLRQEGIDPREAHDAFRLYARELPIVAYNLSFDWDRVLVPEYRRLRVPVAGAKGFCAMTLARRVIRETHNHRLETLKNHFRLSDARSHRGLNDVMSVVSLFQKVFRERLEPSGIVGFEAVARFSRKTPVLSCWEEISRGLTPSEAPAPVARAEPEVKEKPERERPVVPLLSVPKVKAYIRDVLTICRRVEAEPVLDGKAVETLRRKVERCPFPFIYPMCAIRTGLEVLATEGESSGPAREALLAVIRDALAAYTDSQE